MAELDYFPWRHRYKKLLARLSDQELGRLVRALEDFSIDGERKELAGREQFAYEFIVEDIDAAKKAYESKCNQARANASGRKQTQANASGGKRTQADVHTVSYTNTNTVQYNSVCGDVPSNHAPAREDTHTPSTPTEAEIAAYCAENGISIDVKRFFCTYASNGWKDVHGNAVTDWRSKVILWANGDKEKRKAASDVACSTFDTDEFLNLAMKKTF